MTWLQSARALQPLDRLMVWAPENLAATVDSCCPLVKG